MAKETPANTERFPRPADTADIVSGAAQAVPLDLERPFQLSFGGEVKLMQTGVFHSPQYPDCLVFFYEEKHEGKSHLAGRLITTDRFGVPVPGTRSALPYDGRVVNETKRKTGYFGIFSDAQTRLLRDPHSRLLTNLFFNRDEYLAIKKQYAAGTLIDKVATWFE